MSLFIATVAYGWILHHKYGEFKQISHSLIEKQHPSPPKPLKRGMAEEPVEVCQLYAEGYGYRKVQAPHGMGRPRKTATSDFNSALVRF